MLNRVLPIVLTSLATCGLGTAAIARATEVLTTENPQTDPNITISQLDSDDNNSGASQPSPAIQSLQNRLAELGYYEGAANGIFTSETREALTAFQQDNGLVGTGILDPLTQQRLANPEGADAPPETSPESDSAQTGSAPTLDLPPVSESGEVEGSAVTSEGENGESPAATPESDAVGGENTPAGTASQPSEAPEAAAPDEGGRLPLLVVLGVLILVLGGLGTFIVLWLLKRRGQESADPAADSETLQEPGAAAAAPSPPYSSVKPPPPPPSRAATLPNQNGRQPGKPQLPQTSLDVSHQSMAINNPAEPRVAKVNIIDELIQDLQHPDPELRRRAIWELGQRGNSAAVHPLVNLLAEADSHEQSLILAALSEITSQTLKPMNRAIAIALRSENAEVRKNAIRDLTRIYDSLNQSSRMLGHAALDEDPDVRQTADWALSQLNKMRLNPADTAAFLKEGKPQERLPEDESSSHSG